MINESAANVITWNESTTNGVSENTENEDKEVYE